MSADHDLIHGQHAVAAVLDDDPARIVEVWLQRGRDTRLVGELAARLPESVAVHRVDRHRLDELFKGARHQGVVVRARPRARMQLKDLRAQLAGRSAPMLVALDGVEDPHNLGAVLRTADAAGADAVLIPRSRGVALTASARKVASGAAESMTLLEVPNLARALRELADDGFAVVGTDASASGLLYDVDLRGAVVLVLGAEGQGLRPLTAQCCQVRVRLPMHGRVGSLNVAVSAGVCLYEAVRQRLNPGGALD